MAGRGLDQAARMRGVCTGVAASWCPRCGDCTCPREADGSFVLEYPDGPGGRSVQVYAVACPLHNPQSDHAEVILPGGPFGKGRSAGRV
jgi:hypothetical protein